MFKDGEMVQHILIPVIGIIVGVFMTCVQETGIERPAVGNSTK